LVNLTSKPRSVASVSGKISKHFASEMIKYRIVVVLTDKIYVYNFQNLKLIEVIETCSNPSGICALSPSKEICVLAAPEKKPGTVRIVHFDKGSKT
jgi:hypothetical protein